MSQKKDDEFIPAWAEELAVKGVRAGLLSRLHFHGGLHLAWAARMTGLAQNTVKRHFSHMVEQGLAKCEFSGGDLHYRPVLKN